ncbi:MAG: putative membrane protein [Candidatus Nitrotoga sp. LAW]|nr:MAG: putative membrane protein [Candidatus Nitrotoga sp. LAW]
MYLPIMVLSLSLLTAFNVFGAQNDNSPTSHLITSAPISVPYQSSFSSYKPYVEEELSSWRALNEQVTGGDPADHSMDTMKGMDHESMKDIPVPTTQPSVKGGNRGPQQEILLAMNDEKMASKHASIPAIANMPHEHNETKSSASFMKPMAAMSHGSMIVLSLLSCLIISDCEYKDMSNDTGQPSSKESSEQAHQHQNEHAASGGAGGTMPLKINKAGPVIKFELIPNAHPIAVHFPIALTLIALLFSLAARIGSMHNLATQLATVGHWALWISGVTATIAAGLGWLAFNSVDHDDAGHAAMLIHRNWAIPTAVGLLLLAMWDVFKLRAHQVMSWLTLIVLTLLSGSVAVTGWLGGEVVFRHGIGVLSLPEIAAESDPRGHEHGDSDSHSHQHGASTINEESKPAHKH